MRCTSPAGGVALALLLAAWLGLPELRAEETWEDALKENEAVKSLVKQGKYGEALPHAQRYLELVRKLKREDDEDYAGALCNLGSVFYTLGEHAKALPLYERAVEMLRKLLDEEHPNVATSLGNLAALYRSMGEYAKALPLLQRALEIRRKVLGEYHPDVAMCLSNLGGLYASMGEYAKALPPQQQALEMLRMLRERERRGEEHPHVATCLTNLALLYESTGEYAKALALCGRALRLQRRLLGEEHPYVATSLNNLAAVYTRMGEYAKALALHQQALEMRLKLHGEEHPDVAVSLSNLAQLYLSTAEYAKALPLLQRALEMNRKLLGEERPDVATSLNNLAVLYGSMGEYAKALPLHQQALEMRCKLLGEEHPYVATSLDNLAVLYGLMGEYAKALPLHQQALEMRRKRLGEEHPDVAQSLNNLAELAADTGRLEDAWGYAERASRVLLSARARAAASAIGRSSFFAEWVGLDRTVALALTLRKEVDALKLLEEGRSLALRELLAEARAQTAAGLPEKDRLEVAAALGRLNALNAQVEKLAGHGGDAREVRAQLQQAELEYEALMRRLGKRYKQFVATETAKGITSALATQSPALDGQAAIVGWVGYRDWVCGFVVRREGVFWEDLARPGKAAEVEVLVRRAIRGLSGLSPAGETTPPSDFAEELLEIYRRRFAPLEPHLKGIKRLIVIAQSWAATLPIEALLTGEPTGEYQADVASWPWLCDKYEISYAPSATTLDILCRQRVGRKEAEWERMLAAVGDPPFSEQQLVEILVEKLWPERRAPAPPAVAGRRAGAERALALSRAVRLDLSAVPERLPGTRREVEAVARLLGREKSLVFLGPEASERRFFEASEAGELAKCKYVHLATHGLADGERPELSALMLARVPEDKEYDGLLQMREVFHLKLNTDLVVLSACQTGLGKRLSGEGMVGLSTAFFFAGTPSLVVSLWNVPDVSTALLMRRFYADLLAGQEKSAALREAKAWLRHLTRTEAEKLCREAGLGEGLTRTVHEAVSVPKGREADDRPFAHPFYWAPFVLTGDPR